ncbi:MAG: porin [Planctomycetota bacterium]
MLNRSLSTIVLLLAFTSSLVQGQVVTSGEDYSVVGAAYVGQTDDWAEEFAKLNARLSTLEDDVADRIESGDDGGDALDELDERLSELEDGLEDYGESIDDIEGTIPGLVHHSHKGPKLNFFGRIHYDYWAFPNTDPTIFPLEGGNPQDRFLFRRLRLGVKGDINDNVYYNFESEFAGGSSSFRDAYIMFKSRPYLQDVIIGNHKRPYGLDHWNSSRYNPFIERPFIIEAFNQDSRRFGISSWGVSCDQKYNWQVGFFNQVLSQVSGQYVDDHYQPEIAGRFSAMPWYDECSGGRGYAHFAISGSVGNPDGGGPNNAARYRTRPEARTTNRWLDTGTIAGAEENMLIGLEGVINIGAMQIVGEYQRANVTRSAAFGNGLEFDGGYIQVGYFLTGEHAPWDRKRGKLARVKPFENFFAVRDCDCNIRRGWGAIQLVSRYSWADLTDEDIFGGEANSLTTGFNWWFNPYSRLQFNWIMGDVEDNGGAGFGDYNVIGARWMVDF